MTPYEFGRRVKLAAETGGFGEYMGQSFDQGVNWFNKAIGMPEISPGAWAGDAPAPAAAQRREMPGVSDATPAGPPRAPRAPRVMPGVSDAVPAAPPRLAPRPAAAPTAPAQPRPTAPGVRRASGRVA